MKANTFIRAIKVMTLVYGNHTTISKHLGIEGRTFRICRGKIDTLSRSARHRYIVGARAVFLRLLLRSFGNLGPFLMNQFGTPARASNNKLNKNAA